MSATLIDPDVTSIKNVFTNLDSNSSSIQTIEEIVNEPSPWSISVNQKIRWYPVLKDFEVDFSSLKITLFTPKTETFNTGPLEITDDMILDDFLKDDYVVQISPIETSKLKVKIKSVKKAIPEIVKYDEILC